MEGRRSATNYTIGTVLMPTELQTWPQNAFGTRDCASPHRPPRSVGVGACLIYQSGPQPGKMRWCPAAFSNSSLDPFFLPFSFLHGPCHTSGYSELHTPCGPLVCAGRYDVASEKNTSARPPGLIRLTPRQHFLIDRPTVGRPLIMTLMECLTFQVAGDLFTRRP